MELNIELSPQQMQFVTSDADEVLYGGAAGGGKTHAQRVDTFLKAAEYPGCKQIVFRRTLPELKDNFIDLMPDLLLKIGGRYHSADHRWVLDNGSKIRFGYMDSEEDISRYDSEEYDFIRFDEATHFTEKMYTGMKARLRGTMQIRRQMKSSTNPGNVGHQFFKERFIDHGRWGKPFEVAIRYKKRMKTEKRIFIPAKVQDNKHIDDEYIFNLVQLADGRRQQLLEGDWDYAEGRYFAEFKREIHVVKPFTIPDYWERFRSLDYGRDMTACLWYAVSEDGTMYLYRELHEPNLLLSQAAKKILELSYEDNRYTVASPDLWNTQQSTGKTGAEHMMNAGLTGLIKANNARVTGWQILAEYLHPFDDGFGKKTAMIRIFDGCCPNLVKALPQLLHDKHNVDDVSKEPHEITHAPDSLRYGVMSRPPLAVRKKAVFDFFYEDRQKSDSLFTGVTAKDYF